MGILKAATIVLVVGFFSSVIGNAMAEDVSPQKLLDVEAQLRAEQKKNEESKQDIVQLEKKVQCTYKLVKGYESCDATFQEKNAAYMECIEKARKEKDDCLQEMSDDSE
jgi:hypothetical protein